MADPRRIAFVLASTRHGTLLVNRLDAHFPEPHDAGGYGVGLSLLEQGSFEFDEVLLGLRLLRQRRRQLGDGVVALDIGANIGSHAVPWANEMAGWGSLLAFEAQERIFYALAGNLALNNCFNARAMWSALGDVIGSLFVPSLDYQSAASFGSLELQRRPGVIAEPIGQPVDYRGARRPVALVTVDSLELDRIDFIKADVEGMELQVLSGAANSIARCRPIIMVEWIKTGLDPLTDWLAAAGYTVHQCGMNLLAVHREDALSVELVPAEGAPKNV